MSSNMLEQAVIDAEALREAAIKNAEQEVLEKYSGDIREAVDSILEQEDEDLFGGEDEMGLGDEGDMEDRESVIDQVSMAATDGENTCPCPDEGEPLVLDLDQIVAAAEDAAAEEEELEMGTEEPLASEDELFEINDQNLMQAIAEALSEEKEDDDEDQTPEERAEDIEGKGESVASELEKTPPEDKGKVLAALRKKKNEGVEKFAAEIFEDSGAEETKNYRANRKADEKEIKDLEADKNFDARKEKRRDEDLELDEELLDEIVEALVVDLRNVPTGENFHTHPTMGQNERGLDIALAQEQGTEFAEEQKELRQALKKLQEQNKSQTLKMNKQKKEYKQLKSIAIKANQEVRRS